MRKSNQIAWLLMIGCFIFTGCKKGDNDPKFTLHSRKSRLAGDWTLNSAKITVKTVDDKGKTVNETIVLKSSSYEETIPGIGTFTGTHSLKVSFTKDGKVSIEQKADTLHLSAKGGWNFLLKDGDYKNKERVVVDLSTASGSSLNFALFNKSKSSFVYAIKELRDKKLVLTCEDEIVYSEAGKGSYAVSAEYEMGQ